jgi:hypothetical protein
MKHTSVMMLFPDLDVAQWEQWMDDQNSEKLNEIQDRIIKLRLKCNLYLWHGVDDVGITIISVASEVKRNEKQKEEAHHEDDSNSSATEEGEQGNGHEEEHREDGRDAKRGKKSA